jgi:hypothetical protein
MARKVPYNTDNGLITIDARNEVVTVISDNDTIVRVFLFEDRIIITSNKEASIQQDGTERTNILIR